MSDGELLMRMRAVRGLLQGFQYRYASEVQLHDRIGEVLTTGGYKFAREVAVRLPPEKGRRLGVADPSKFQRPALKEEDSRFDFLLDPMLVIEVKVDGSLSAALRQIHKYCRLEEVQGVLLASAAGWGRSNATTEMHVNGKPVVMAYLRRPSL